MASSGKKRTTMAKLNRENKLRERRIDKQQRRDARRQGIQPGPFADVQVVPLLVLGADRRRTIDFGEAIHVREVEAHAFERRAVVGLKVQGARPLAPVVGKVDVVDEIRGPRKQAEVPAAARDDRLDAVRDGHAAFDDPHAGVNRGSGRTRLLVSVIAHVVQQGGAVERLLGYFVGGVALGPPATRSERRARARQG